MTTYSQFHILFLWNISYACHLKCNQWNSEKNTCPTTSHIFHMKFNRMCYKVESFVTLSVSLFSPSESYFCVSLSLPGLSKPLSFSFKPSLSLLAVSFNLLTASCIVSIQNMACDFLINIMCCNMYAIWLCVWMCLHYTT